MDSTSYAGMAWDWKSQNFRYFINYRVPKKGAKKGKGAFVKFGNKERFLNWDQIKRMPSDPGQLNLFK